MARKKNKNRSGALPSGADAPGKNYPTVTPRITQDDGYNPYLDVKKVMGNLGLVAPKIPYQIYDIIDYLTLTDPYISKYHNSTVTLANSGHNLVIDAPSVKRAQEAVDISNTMAMNCFPLAGDIGGLISGCFSQFARTGATCVEWTPDPTLSAITRAFLVPIKSLRFTYDPDGGGYILCQQQIGIHTEHIGIVQLNTNQTMYYNAVVRDGNPYPVPPLISAIEPSQNHKKIINKIGVWMDKLSALGVMLAKVEPPPRLPGETQEAYDQKAQVFLDKIAKSVSNNMSSGLGVAYSNVEFSFQNTQAGAAGAHDLLQMVLLGLFASMGRDPIMFGWNLGTSDTFIKVVYEELMKTLAFYQSGVKKVVEMGHRLNLALHGMGDCAISVNFNAPRSLDQFRDSEAEYMDSKKYLEQMTSDPPAISPEEARSKLGYDQVTTKDNSFTASFSSKDNKYYLNDKPKKYVQVFKNIKPDHEEKDQVDRLTQIIKESSDKGFHAFSAWLGFLGNINKGLVVNTGTDTYVKAAEDSIKPDIVSAVTSNWIRESWDRGQGDPELFKTEEHHKNRERGPAEIAALLYLATVVGPYMVNKWMSRSEWRLETTRNKLSELYDKYDLDHYTAESMNAFREECLKYFSKSAENAATVIGKVDGARAQIWGSLFAISGDGTQEFEIVGPDDNLTCEFCREMIGKRFSVDAEIKNIQDMVDQNNPDLGDLAEFITKRFGGSDISALSSSTSEELQADGLVIPPYHPRCRHWIEAV